MNTKKYYTCDFNAGVATAYGLIPEVWSNVNGMLDLSDELLADLAWAGHPGIGFIPEGAAILKSIDQNTMNSAYKTARLVGVELLRGERDLLLAESDKYVLPDRWESYSTEKKAAWTAYRKALRELPITADPMNYEFPKMPS